MGGLPISPETFQKEKGKKNPPPGCHDSPLELCISAAVSSPVPASTWIPAPKFLPISSFYFCCASSHSLGRFFLHQASSPKSPRWRILFSRSPLSKSEPEHANYFIVKICVSLLSSPGRGTAVATASPTPECHRARMFPRPIVRWWAPFLSKSSTASMFIALVYKRKS